MQKMHDKINIYLHYSNLSKINTKLLSSRLSSALGERVTTHMLTKALRAAGYEKRYEYIYDDPGCKRWSNRYKLTHWCNDYGTSDDMRLQLKQPIKDEQHYHFVVWLSCNNRPLLSYADIALFWPEYTKVELVEMVNLYFETWLARAKNLNKTQRSISLVQVANMSELQYCESIRDVGYLYDEIVLKNYKITPRHYFESESNNHAKQLQLTEL